MPSRLHVAVRQPPSTLDRLSAHEWQATIVAGAWAALGGLLCWSWIDPGGGPATVLSQMNAWLAGGVAVALLVCGLALLVAVIWPGKDATAWRIELVAIPLGAMAWASYGAVTPSIWWRIIVAGYLLGCALRWHTAWHGVHRPPPPQVVVVVEE